jgi:hypothetical protein
VFSDGLLRLFEVVLDGGSGEVDILSAFASFRPSFAGSFVLPHRAIFDFDGKFSFVSSFFSIFGILIGYDDGSCLWFITSSRFQLSFFIPTFHSY